MTKNEIKAKVLTEWNHIEKCKFYPGDKARVCFDKIRGLHNVSNKLLFYDGEIGNIVAVTCTEGGRIRGDGRRMYTRYYVEFVNGWCGGFHSHYLEKV